MIRTAWVFAVAGSATIFYGLIAIGAALLRVRSNIYTWATREWARAIIRASGCRVETVGLENIKLDAPQVIASNHTSGYDIFSLASVLPVPFSFVAKKELERIPFFGTAWKAAGHISIDRANRQKAIASLQRAGRKIREDDSTVIIFPEGTRSPDGNLLPFKKGAFLLASSAAVPIIPTIISGSNRVVGRGLRMIRPTTIHIHFGTPIDPAAYQGEGSDALLEIVRARMQEMLDRSRVTRGHVARESLP